MLTGMVGGAEPGGRGGARTRSRHHSYCKGRQRMGRRCSTDDNDHHEPREMNRYEREFTELAQLGHGAFGMVYKARNKLDNNLYAVKKTIFQLRPKKYLTMQDKSKEFLNEVALLSKMDHMNVVRYFAAWVDEEWTTVKAKDPSDDKFASLTWLDDPSEEEMPVGSPCYCITVYMQMALYEVDSLKQRIENESRVADPACNIVVLVQILHGLHYVHQKGIVHRDVTPSNIFFTEDGTIKIGDFGLSIVDNSSRSRSNSLQGGEQPAFLPPSPCHHQQEAADTSGGVGTAIYASPEQLEGRGSTFGSDVFSVGVIMVELYHAPFRSQMERYRTICQARTGTLPACIQEKFHVEAGIMTSCLQSDPATRPTCEELLRSSEILFLCDKYSPPLPASPLCGASSASSTPLTATSPLISPMTSPTSTPTLRGLTEDASLLHGALGGSPMGLSSPPTSSSGSIPQFSLSGRSSPLATHGSMTSPQLAWSGCGPLPLPEPLARHSEPRQYAECERHTMIMLLLERDQQIEALRARNAALEDQLLAQRSDCTCGSARDGLSAVLP